MPSTEAWRRFRAAADRTGRHPASVGARALTSLLRKHVPGLQRVPVAVDDRGTRMYADLRTPLGLSMYRYGFPEPESLLIQRLLHPGDIFIDGGANVGIFTVLGARAVGPRGRVIACEPVPQTMALLRDNVALNRFAWVETKAVALADTTGTITLYSFGAGSALSSFAPATPSLAEPIDVDADVLDEVAGTAPESVSLVKLDIEGAEVRALRGATGLLAAKVDFLVEVEPAHLERQGSTLSEMYDVFADHRYSWYEIRGSAREVSLVRMRGPARPAASPNVYASARALDDLPDDVRVSP